MSDAPVAAPAAPAAPVVANDNASPDNPLSQAGKTLASARAARRAILQSGASRNPLASSADARAEASPAGTSTTPAASSESANPASAEPEKASTAADNDDIAALIREDRRLKVEARRIEARAAEVEGKFKQFEALLPRIQAFDAAMAKNDLVGALRGLHPDKDLTSDLFWDLAKQVGEQGEPQQVDFDKLLEEKLTARQQAEREAAEKRQRDQRESAEQEMTEARGVYVQSCGEYLTSHIKDYPAVHALGVSTDRIRTFVEEEFHTQHKRIPSVKETLDAMESELRERVKLTGMVPQAEPPRPVAPTVSSSWRSDPGRPAPEGAFGRRSLDQIRAERKASLVRR